MMPILNPSIPSKFARGDRSRDEKHELKITCVQNMLTSAKTGGPSKEKNVAHRAHC